MLPPLASRIALRKRALPSGSPPPLRAATVISLINFVNSLPRLASSAPFLCLILCHLECPDIGLRSFWSLGCQGREYITRRVFSRKDAKTRKDTRKTLSVIFFATLRETILALRTLSAPQPAPASRDRRLSKT